MSEILGWSCNADKSDASRGELSRLLDPGDGYRGGDGAAPCIQGDRIGIAVAGTELQSGAAQSGALIGGITGAYSWDDDDLNRIVAEGGAGAALLNAFRRYGNDLVSGLTGSFSFCVGDDNSGDLLLGVDRFCSRQLAYAQIEDTLLFGSNIRSLRRHSRLGNNLNPNALLAYFFFHAVPLRVSTFTGIDKLGPAQTICWEKGQVQRSQYFESRFDASYSDRSFDSLRDDIFDRLSREVKRMAVGPETGTFLSGGIDSSTITGMLCRIAASSKSYSIGFDAAGYDELTFARKSAIQFGSKQFEYYVTPDDVVDAAPAIAKHFSEPFGNASAIPTYLCGKLAKENNTTRLLAGDGGDELFGGNERYSYQNMLSLYSRVPALIRKSIEAVTLRSRFSESGLLSKAGRYVQKAGMPLPDRLYVGSLMNELNWDYVFDEGFLNRVNEDTPRDVYSDVWAETAGESLLNRQLAHDWYFTLACSDLPKVSGACEMAGVEVAYPFLGNSVIDFSSHLPDTEKVKGAQLRKFFKHAMREFLPKDTIQKSKHGFGLPFGIWLSEPGPLRDFALDNLAALRKREILNSEFLTDLVDNLHPQHPQYYGVMVWVALMLELFFQHQIDGRAD